MTQKSFWIFILVLVVLFARCGESRKNQRKKHFLHKGNLAYKEKMYQDAIRYYQEAINEDSAFAQAYNNLGIVYFKTKKLEDALIAFNHSIDFDLNFTDAYYNRSNVLHERGDFEKALSDLNRIQ
ncbi:MAG: tetratricopeptide repeat protein, partial [Cyclobacteriaceae bacterium]|nr:tetratricopeptide repeat protein [Cyclobacteriaceae bacterium]